MQRCVFRAWSMGGATCLPFSLPAAPRTWPWDGCTSPSGDPKPKRLTVPLEAGVTQMLCSISEPGVAMLCVLLDLGGGLMKNYGRKHIETAHAMLFIAHASGNIFKGTRSLRLLLERGGGRVGQEASQMQRRMLCIVVYQLSGSLMA